LRKIRIRMAVPLSVSSCELSDCLSQSTVCRILARDTQIFSFRFYVWSPHDDSGSSYCYMTWCIFKINTWTFAKIL